MNHHPEPHPAAALQSALAGYTVARLRGPARQLIASYQRAKTPPASLLDTPTAAAAYAAYRLPATHAVARAVFDAITTAAPRLRPRTCLDVGGGSGAALWAAAAAFPKVDEATVIDRSQPVLDLGRELAAASHHPTLRQATWTHTELTTTTRLPDTDLVVASYLLGDLTKPTRQALLDSAARAQLVVFIEPGTRKDTPAFSTPDRTCTASSTRPSPHAPTTAPARWPTTTTGATSPPGSTGHDCTANSRTPPPATKTNPSPTSRRPDIPHPTSPTSPPPA